MHGDSRRSLFGCRDLDCPGLWNGIRLFPRVIGGLFGVLCRCLAGCFFRIILGSRLCGLVIPRPGQIATFGITLPIIQRIERLLEIALADLISSGHAVDNRRGVGVVLAIFDHLVGEAEHRVQLNPMFRFADEMVEYGENYTDAATVIDGMTTAYQVGKGYLQKAFNALDDGEGDAEGGDLPGSGDDKAAQPAAQDDPEEAAGKTSAKDAEQAANDAGEEANAVPQTGAVEVAASEEASPAVPMQAVPTQDELPSEEPPRPRPQRMTFRRPAG